MRIFDSGSEWMKIYTRDRSSTLEAGYHAFIAPSSASSLPYSSWSTSDVVLTWKPPWRDLLGPHGQAELKIGPRYYWDAQTTHDWLQNKIIPIALKWEYSKGYSRAHWLTRKLSWRKSPKHAVEYQAERFVYSSLRPKITREEVKNVQTLTTFIERLQVGVPLLRGRFFLSLQGHQNLYRALGEVLGHTKVHDWMRNYIVGNLPWLKSTPLDQWQESILEYANGRVAETTNSFEIDLALRSFIELLRNGQPTINEVETQFLARSLGEIDRIVSRGEFLRRHQEILGSSGSAIASLQA